MIMRILMMAKKLPSTASRDCIEKKCRRCVKVFNNDDFYYFFTNLEEEMIPILTELRKSIACGVCHDELIS